jgi:hypothetical protein
VGLAVDDFQRRPPALKISVFLRIHFWNELLSSITFFWSFAVSFRFGTDWISLFYERYFLFHATRTFFFKKNRVKQCFKKVVERSKIFRNTVSKKNWKSSKSSGIRVDRTHPNSYFLALGIPSKIGFLRDYPTALKPQLLAQHSCPAYLLSCTAFPLYHATASEERLQMKIY